VPKKYVEEGIQTFNQLTTLIIEKFQENLMLLAILLTVTLGNIAGLICVYLLRAWERRVRVRRRVIAEF
jgi:hypothetical protein